MTTPLELLESRIADLGELPVFRESVREVMRLGEDTQCSASDLARVILKDQGFAVKVLRVANSPYYNRSDRAIKTISRAVVILGVETIRDVCMGLGLIELFQKHHPQINLKSILVRSYFAANLARNFAEHIPGTAWEEAFLASLMQFLGPIAVAYYLPGKYIEIRQLARSSGRHDSSVESKILGFRFEDFSAALAAKWALPDYLVRCLDDGYGPDEENRVQRLSKISFNIAQSLFSDEASDTDLESGMKTLVKVFGMKESKITELVEDSYLKTKKSSAFFGIEARALKPRQDSKKSGSIHARLAGRLRRKDKELQPEKSEPEPLEKELPRDPNALQVDLLHEIALHILERRDLSTLFNLIMEGIQKVVAFDRIILALCNPERTEIRGRYGLGLNVDALIENFKVPLHESNLFGRCLLVRKSEFVADTESAVLQALLPVSIQGILAADSFVISPIYSTDRELGLFYADNSLSGRVISPNDFRKFEHFALQANLGIDRQRAPK